MSHASNPCDAAPPALFDLGAVALFVADPKVAEVRPASPTSLFVFGVGPGRTTVALSRHRIGEDWVADHTHMSLFRDVPSRSFGPRKPV